MRQRVYSIPYWLAGTLVVRLVALAEGTHVHHEDVHLRLGVVLPGHDGFFGGVHAADRRAVVVGLVARADALQKGDLPGGLPVGGAHDVADGRAGGAESRRSNCRAVTTLG